MLRTTYTELSILGHVIRMPLVQDLISEFLQMNLRAPFSSEKGRRSYKAFMEFWLPYKLASSHLARNIILKEDRTESMKILIE